VNGFKMPGVVWTALLVGLPMLAVWLEQFFPGAIWAAPVAGLLLIIAKVVEVIRAGTKEEAIAATSAAFDSGGAFVAREPRVEREPRSLWWG